jgi:indole-3-glycerol phosphate synthase
MSILDAIVEKKRERIEEAKSRAPIGELKIRIDDMGANTRDFTSAVKRPKGKGIRLIAEMKKASPSKGPIREDFHPAEIASAYAGRADAISVLTEEDFFLGSLAHLREAKGAAPLPVLRKDFIIDEYQLYESRAAGADAVLLIEALLDKKQAGEYLELARELGLGVLFEVRDEWGLEIALDIGAQIIGINNRDLKTFKIDLDTTLDLVEAIHTKRTVVSESGIEQRADVVKLSRAGVDAVLVGTAFMEATDIEAKIKELMGEK